MPNQIILVKQVKKRAPKKRAPKRGGASMQGDGFFDFVKKAHDFVKNNRIISKTADVVNNIASKLPSNAYTSAIGNVAGEISKTSKSYGYGKKRIAGGRKTMVRR